MSRPIDADALIDGYKHMGYDPSEHQEESYMEGWCKGFNSAVDHCIYHVIHAPTIQPMRKRGKWIIEKDATGATYGRCSVCGIKQYGGYMNFCYECGADMREGEEE